MVIKLGNIYGFTGGNKQPMIVESKKQIPIDGTINKPRGGLTVANCIKTRYDCGISNQRQIGTMVLEVRR